MTAVLAEAPLPLRTADLKSSFGKGSLVVHLYTLTLSTSTAGPEGMGSTSCEVLTTRITRLA